MLDSLRTRAETRRKASEIYGAVVTKAREPGFYAALGVPDTPSGRYEMVTLHLFLVLERLRAVTGENGPLPRMLVEAFVADMDDSLRELGTGDLAVPKKVRRAASGLYGRSMAYRTALQTGAPDALEPVFLEHVYACASHAGAPLLARYTRDAAAALAAADPLAEPVSADIFPSLPGSVAEGP